MSKIKDFLLITRFKHFEIKKHFDVSPREWKVGDTKGCREVRNKESEWTRQLNEMPTRGDSLSGAAQTLHILQSCDQWSSDNDNGQDNIEKNTPHPRAHSVFHVY
jgi:hypothetical protein